MNWTSKMSKVLPSSESNFFDYNQNYPINTKYPSPSNLFTAKYSGVYSTFNPENLPHSIDESGIFAYNNLSGQFSNYTQFDIINNFQSFNTYIHYYPQDINDLDDITENNKNRDYSLKIPYLSSYKINTFTFNPYGPLF